MLGQVRTLPYHLLFVQVHKHPFLSDFVFCPACTHRASDVASRISALAQTLFPSQVLQHKCTWQRKVFRQIDHFFAQNIKHQGLLTVQAAGQTDSLNIRGDSVRLRVPFGQASNSL